MKEIEVEIRDYLKSQSERRNIRSTMSFTIFSVIFILVNMYMIYEIATVSTNSAVVMNYLYNKWIALSVASGLAALISKN